MTWDCVCLWASITNNQLLAFDWVGLAASEGPFLAFSSQPFVCGRWIGQQCWAVATTSKFWSQLSPFFCVCRHCHCRRSFLTLWSLWIDTRLRLWDLLDLGASRASAFLTNPSLARPWPTAAVIVYNSVARPCLHFSTSIYCWLLFFLFLILMQIRPDSWLSWQKMHRKQSTTKESYFSHSQISSCP